MQIADWGYLRTFIFIFATFPYEYQNFWHFQLNSIYHFEMWITFVVIDLDGYNIKTTSITVKPQQNRTNQACEEDEIKWNLLRPHKLI